MCIEYQIWMHGKNVKPMNYVTKFKDSSTDINLCDWKCAQHQNQTVAVDSKCSLFVRDQVSSKIVHRFCYEEKKRSGDLVA